MRNGQAYQWKTEKFSVSEEKKFGKIDSWNHYEENLSRVWDYPIWNWFPRDGYSYSLPQQHFYSKKHLGQMTKECIMNSLLFLWCKNILLYIDA